MSEGAGAVRIREGPRVPFESTVWLGAGDGEEGSSYRTENLSSSGAMLRGARPLVAVGPVSFRFNSPKASLQGEGTVAWIRRAPSPGDEDYMIGFTFLEVSEDSTRAIEELLSAEVLSRAAAEAPLVAAAPDGSLDSLEVAEKRRGGPVGEGETVPVKVVEPRPETARQGSGIRRGSVLGGIGAAFVAGVAGWIAFGGFGREVVRPGTEPQSEAAPLSTPMEIDVAPSQATLPPPRPRSLAPKEAPAAVLENDQTVVAAGAARIVSVKIVDLASGTGIRVQADAPFAESSLSTLVLGGDSPRFVVRIADLEGPLDQSLPTLKTSEASGIRAGWHETDRGGEVHLVFDLTSPDIAASAAVSNGGILVRLDRTD